MGKERSDAIGGKNRFPVPKLKDLIAERKDMRENGQKTVAIIIPSKAKPEILIKHLNALSRQTSKDFDAIVIYGLEDRFIDAPPDISIIHLRRSYDFGSAGAFYCGERFAYEEGYQRMILADDDCIPESDDLIESIRSSLDQHLAVMPKTRFRPNEPPQTYVFAQYGGFRRDVLEKTGYSFFPFFFGAEDVDLKDRIVRSGIEVASIDKVVSHPPPQNFLLWGMNKTHYFLRNSNIYSWIKFRSKTLFFLTCFGSIMTTAYLHAIGLPSLGRRYIRALSSTSSMRFMKEDLGDDDRGEISKRMPSPNQMPFNDHPAYLRFNIWYGFPALWPTESGIMTARKSMAPLMRELFGYCLKSIRCFGKEIHVKNWESDFHLLPILFARGSTAEFDGEVYEISARRGRLGIFFGLALTAASIAPAAILSALLTLRMGMHKPGWITERYGLEQIVEQRGGTDKRTWRGPDRDSIQPDG